MNVLPGIPFRIQNANVTSSAINLAGDQRVVIACPPPLQIIHSKVVEPFSYSVSQPLSDSVKVVHYKLAPVRLHPVHKYETLQQHDDERLKNDWREKVTISDRYEKHRAEFLQMQG